VRNTIEQAQMKYSTGMACIRKEKNYRRARKELEPLVYNTNSKAPGKLHPQDAIRLNALIPLMNCLRYENDLKCAVDVNKMILDFMEQQAKLHLPENTSEVSDFWQNLGELCNSLAKEYRLSNRIPLEKKWHKDARNAFDHAAKIRSIVFGPSHPKTLLVKKYLSQPSM
jgi:SET and MYND domain-containing protein